MTSSNCEKQWQKWSEDYSQTLCTSSDLDKNTCKVSKRSGLICRSCVHKIGHILWRTVGRTDRQTDAREETICRSTLTGGGGGGGGDIQSFKKKQVVDYSQWNRTRRIGHYIECPQYWELVPQNGQSLWSGFQYYFLEAKPTLCLAVTLLHMRCPNLICKRHAIRLGYLAIIKACVHFELCIVYYFIFSLSTLTGHLRK